MKAGAALAVVVTAAVVGPHGQQTPQPTFRTTGSLVTVDVQVRDGTRLVRGLTAADFQISDNGVPQKVEMLDVESLPIDLTLVVDTSGSIVPMLEQLRMYVRDAAAALRVDDRFRLITFAGDVREATPLLPADERLPIERLQADGATSIVDAATASLMRTRQGDRRQIVAVFTDGIETNSALDGAALESVAKRSDSVLYVFLVSNPMYVPVWSPADTRGYWLSRVDFDVDELVAAATATGGAVERVNVRTELPALLRRTLEDYRTSYVLRYAPAGVAEQGWHAIEVRVPESSHRVRARAGYFWTARR